MNGVMKRPTQTAGFRGGRDSAAVQENIELLTGQRGNGLDRAVTVRELGGLGIAEIKRLAHSNKLVLTPSPKPEDKVIVELPHAPVTVQIYAGFSSIMVAWDAPTFKGFAHAEIWRNSIDELSSAVLIGTTPATMFSDTVQPGVTFYYWVRFVNINDIPGPYQAVDGQLAQTNPDVGQILDELGEQMRGSQAYKELQASDSAVSDALEQAKADLANNDKAIQSGLDTANDRIDQASLDLNAANKRIDQANTVLAAAKLALENADSQLAAELDSRITQAMADLAAADSAISNALVNTQKDLEAADALLQGNINNVDERLSQAKTNLATADSQLQSSIDSVGDHLTAAKSQLESADSDLKASLNQAKDELDNANQQLDSKVDLVKRDLQSADTAIQTSLDTAKAELEDEVARVEAGYQAGDTANLATIKDLEKTVADVTQVIAQQISQLSAAYETRSGAETATTDAKITETKRVLADADRALSEALTALEAAFKAADATLSGSISSLAKTVADENQVISQRIDKVESDYKAADVQASASVTALAETVASEDQALSTRLDGVEAAYKAADTATNATISGLQKTVADGDAALSEQIASVDAAYKVADTATNASVKDLTQTVADNQQSISKRVDTVESNYKAADAATNSAITSLSETIATNDQAASTRMDGIESAYKAADTATNAAVTGLSKTVSDNDQAISERVDGVEAAYKSGDEVLAGSVSSLSKTVTDNQQAISERVDKVESDYQAADAETKASVTSLTETVSREDGALASRIDNIQAGVDDLSGSITEQKQVDATADKILAMQVSQLDAAYSARSGAETAATDAKITETQRVLTEADRALAEDIKKVDAAYKKANETLAGTIAEQLKVVADENQVTSQRLDTVESSINGENGLAAKVETNASAISTIDKDGSQAHKALWQTKASVGDITAGIGLVVDDQGKSQAVVSASQFFVYDPNQPSTITPLFAIDDGQVIIPDALIEKAAVRILNAQEITATKIAASTLITTPLLLGATGTFKDINSDHGTFFDATMIRAVIQNATITGTLAAKSATIKDVTLERATISGTLLGVDGKFTGTVQVGDSFYVDDDLVRVNSNKFYVTTPTGDKPLLAVSGDKLTMPHVSVGSLDVEGTARIADNEVAINAAQFWVYNGTDRQYSATVELVTQWYQSSTDEISYRFAAENSFALQNELSLSPAMLKSIELHLIIDPTEGYTLELVLANNTPIDALHGYNLRVKGPDIDWSVSLSSIIDEPSVTYTETNDPDTGGTICRFNGEKRKLGTGTLPSEFAALSRIMQDRYGSKDAHYPGLTFTVEKTRPEGKRSPLFAVSGDKVTISYLMVKDAVIQSLEAETIVADEVAANAKLTSPVITGGRITGTNLRGGDVGIGNDGVHGPFSGYNTWIDGNGKIYAANVHLSGHITATSGTFDGTVYARNLVGDVYRAAMVPIVAKERTESAWWVYDYTFPTVWDMNRYVEFPTVSLTHGPAIVDMYFNNSHVKRETYDYYETDTHTHIQYVPAGTPVRIRMIVTPSGAAATIKPQSAKAAVFKA